MRLKLIVGLAVAVAAGGSRRYREAQSKRPLIAVMDFDYGRSTTGGASTTSARAWPIRW